ncbi:nucleoside-diphosphate sugar epimerase/dehydratase [Oscillatoria sp. FACHB-1406]|uniref:polysaccharide biosynthesis protein n=1 Tax=Oscillatoria sp. FACHB-1406 TaxID=2692846 RepID=UPI001687C7C9|nr:nucleoside-diphosphate sugar epimerase/dehydratase [Oscillatoria sp. FACHB-1406]MBD2577209.1 polysaccharide biosynthesis protein [Oscillatoria sp. FACHB-1406]
MVKRFPFPSTYRFAQFALDAFTAGFAFYLAFPIRFEGSVVPPHDTIAIVLPLLAIPGRLLTNAAFGLYQQVWRLFGFKDFIRLFNAVTFFSLFTLVLTRLLLPRWWLNFVGVPLGVSVIDWCFCLMGMVALRYARRRSAQQPLWRRRQRNEPQKRVLLIGAGQAGSLVAQEVRQNPSLNFKVVGFLDDDRTKVGRTVEGIKVLGTTSQLVAIAQYHQVKEVLIAMPSARAEQIRHIVALARGTSLDLKIIPSHGELLRDRSLAPQAREIQIQDILGRAEIHLDFAEQFDTLFSSAQEQVAGRTILVTGAGGTIGSEICRQIARLAPQRLLLLGRGENSIFHVERSLKRQFPTVEMTPLIADIRHRDRIEWILKTWQPDIIFHAAAHKHVPLMQHNPTEALENNSLASAQLAALAQRYGVKSFVMISTDKAVDPRNFMGASKRLAELLVKAQAHQSNTRFLVVRFGNVLGSRGSVVPIFQEQIARGGPVTVTDREMTRYFMTAPEASQLVIQSLAVGKSGQTLILDMGQPVRIYDLAEQAIELAGFVPHVDIPIEIIGLRPGEKLHESLVCKVETVEITPHPKIVAVVGGIPDFQAAEQAILMLQNATQNVNDSEELWAIAQQCQTALESSNCLTRISTREQRIS